MTVLMDGLCVVNSANCDRLVIPQDGCCPICGKLISRTIEGEGKQGKEKREREGVASSPGHSHLFCVQH